jgi:hypothetical protein
MRDETDDRTEDERYADDVSLMRKFRPTKRLGSEQYLQPEQMYDSDPGRDDE